MTTGRPPRRGRGRAGGWPGPGGFSRRRDVSFERTWEASLAKLRGGQPPPAPIDEVLEDFDWTVARIGDQYYRVGGTDLRVVEIPPAKGLPRLNAWFSIGADEMVHAIEVEVVESEREEDEGGGPELDP